jgi:DinB superfamily/Pentapeptide repeats (8 copies)
MAEFSVEDLSDSRFEYVLLRRASFDNVDLSGSTFRMVDLTGVTIRAALLYDMEIKADIRNLRINGVDVVPLVEAELDRQQPDRAKMRPSDPAGFREAWDLIETRWADTVQRARGFDPELLHERVDGEWSFIETLRHLVFATDARVRRLILLDPKPWDPLDLPHDEMTDQPGVPRDRDARPSLDEVLALRRSRMATVRDLLAGLDDETLAGMTEPVTEPGYPEPRAFPVSDCLLTVLNEEWEHRNYAERDLTILESRSA